MNALDTLILSLPTRDSTVRMRVWRALKESGCAVLRDGVYVLPAGSARAAVLGEMASEVRSAGGFAVTAELRLAKEEPRAELRRLFDRGAEYGVLVEAIGDARRSLRRLGPRKAQTTLHRLRRLFDRLAEIDFFPGQAKRQAEDALAGLASEVHEAYSSGEPHASRRRVRAVDAAGYRGRVWATRKDPWVDRLASAWLIKRFIDRDARFVWIDRPRDRPKRAVGFDFDGAAFTHSGNRVTFEVLRAAFGLEDDPALAKLGAAVHFLDVGGIPVADAKGLETMLRGIKERARSDDALLAEAMRIFDLFYAAYSPAAERADAR
jgi:hypothetical protein